MDISKSERLTFILLIASLLFLLPADAGGQAIATATVKLRMKELDGSHAVVEATIKNQGKQTIFVVVDTVREDGTVGPYIDAVDITTGLLVLASRFYSPSPFAPNLDSTAGYLLRLDGGESSTRVIDLQFPLRTTVPPFGKQPKLETIRQDSVKRIQLQLGILPGSTSLVELVRRKGPPHDHFSGFETIGVSNLPLYKVQDIISSNTLELRKK